MKEVGKICIAVSHKFCCYQHKHTVAHFRGIHTFLDG